MSNFLHAQMDYIFFFYGLAFIGLAGVSYILSKESSRLPWKWLAWFGLSHGVNEWLDLLALAWTDPVWFKACRWTVLIASFLFLVEFGRSSLVRQVGHGPRRWILAILVFFGCLGAWSGWSGLDASTRYALGLIGGLGAGLAFYREARLTSPPRSTWLLAGATGFVLYGLAAGVVVPGAHFFPASVGNYQTFTHVTGLPVQLVRGLLAVVIAAISVGYFRATWPSEIAERPRYQTRSRYTYGTGAALCIILLAGWVLTQSLGDMGRDQIRKDSDIRTKLIIQRLIFELEEAEAAVKAMSGSPWIGPALRANSPQNITQANSVLDRYQARFEAAPAFLLDQTGTAIASSNREAPDSFVGHNFAFRPYFQEAMAGRPGRYFALGTVSKKLGFFASYPVLDPEGKIAGVVGIKILLDKFQRELRGCDPAFLIDPYGVIFLGSRLNLDPHSLWPVTHPDPAGLKLQFGTSNFEPVFPHPQTDGATVMLGGKTYLFCRQAIEATAMPGWTVVLLAPDDLVAVYRFLGIVIVFVVVVIALLAAGSNLYIAEIKRAEQKASELAAIVQFSEDAVIGMNLDGIITSWNIGAEKICGYTGREVIGEAISILFPPGLKGEVPQIREKIESGEYVEHYETVVVRKDGHIINISLTVSPIRDAEGKIVGASTIGRDITERKQEEEERRRLEERLQRAEKMEALGTLAGGVAHDLNNVLGIVMGYSELLLNDLDESSSARSKATDILKGGQRAAAIVQDLLTLARRGVPSRKVLNLNNIVLECQKSPEFAKVLSYHPNIEIETDFESGLMNMSGSSIHLEKSFINLVSNAAEAMPNGGTLTVRTATCYLDKPISGYDEVREGDYVVLSISDTGEGIAASDLKRIFEPFYTKKIMGRSGTGLGLAVVWGTVKDHLGYINVGSEEGKGTTFTLYFPVTREEITPEHVSLSAAGYMGNGESILVVDDVKEQQALASTMLKKLNYSVVSVSSGEEGVEYLKGNAVDLVILDMIMDPGMDGLDTYSRILEIHPHQKAIIVSGFSETERVTRAQALGAGSYVKKPYLLEKLGLAVRNELDRAP